MSRSSLHNVQTGRVPPPMPPVHQMHVVPASLKDQFTIERHENIQRALALKDFDPDLIHQFATATQLTGPVSLAYPIDEPEFGLYFNSQDSLAQAACFLSRNKHSYLATDPTRNFLYMTLPQRHKDPNHSLNTELSMQWRVDVEINDQGEVVFSNIRFCVKTREKSLIRQEWEVSGLTSGNPEHAFIALAHKYGEKLPAFLRENLRELAQSVYVTAPSVTSRTGYNGIQLRKKWGNAISFHQFSHDAQIAAAPGLLNEKGVLKKLAKRFEGEDEVVATLILNPIGYQCLDTLTKGALDIHRRKIINHAKRAGMIVMQSSMSKPVFAENAALGIFDDSAIKAAEASAYVMTQAEMQAMNYQAYDYMTSPQLMAGIFAMVTQLPAKGSIFPQNFKPNSLESHGDIRARAAAQSAKRAVGFRLNAA